MVRNRSRDRQFTDEEWTILSSGRTWYRTDFALDQTKNAPFLRAIHFTQDEDVQGFDYIRYDVFF